MRLKLGRVSAAPSSLGSRQLSAAVENLEIKTSKAMLQITASFGVSHTVFQSDQRQSQEVTMESLINEADENLYRSKQQGRNRVTATQTSLGTNR